MYFQKTTTTSNNIKHQTAISIHIVTIKATLYIHVYLYNLRRSIAYMYMAYCQYGVLSVTMASFPKLNM